MRPVFDATISALCYSLLNRDLEPADTARMNNAAAFVLAQHRRMPDFLQAPLLVLTLVFNGHAFVKTGAPFHRLDPPLRRAHLQSWQASRLGFKRDFIRLVESLALLAWNSGRTFASMR